MGKTAGHIEFGGDTVQHHVSVKARPAKGCNHVRKINDAVACSAEADAVGFGNILAVGQNYVATKEFHGMVNG